MSVYLSWIDISVFVTTIFLSLYFYFVHRFKYWERNGVYSPKATFPVGHIGDVIKGKTQMGVKVVEIYEEHKHRPYVGLYFLHSKVLMVNDLDLIKNILVRDFKSFSSHGIGFSPENDPLANQLFTMDGPEWKRFRVKLTPTFTSSKMKYMFDTMLVCSKNMQNYLEDRVDSNNIVDFKETLARYTTDVIGSCAFGIEADCFQYPDADFRKIGKRIFEPAPIKSFKESMAFIVPSLIKRFKIRLIYKDVEDFLVKSIGDTIEYRKENNITRNDFLQLLIDMKNEDELSNESKPLQFMELVSQVFIFFIAGFETSSSAASFALYEIAKNPRVQEKLRADIDAVTAKHDGKITYESVGEMNYLTQTIEETIRMYPPLPCLFRRCGADYKIPDSNIIVEKDTLVMIPILGIHRDPNIHESPLEFRPERFSAENKKRIQQFTYLPFGEGPRICIGNRFGMMQTRLGIISVLSKYDVSVCDETLIPMAFEPKAVLLTAKGEQYLKLTRRKYNDNFI